MYVPIFEELIDKSSCHHQANANLLRASAVTLKTTYRHHGSMLFIQTYFSPYLFTPLTVPPITCSYTRLLFPDRPTQGTITAQLGPQPVLSINLLSSSNFSLLPLIDPSAPLDEEPSGAQAEAEAERGYAALPTPGTLGAFKHGSTYSSCGMSLAGPGTALRGEMGITFPEVGLSLKASIGAPLIYLGSILEAFVSATWEWGPADGMPDGELVVAGNGGGSISAGVGLDADGVALRLEYAVSLPEATWIAGLWAFPVLQCFICRPTAPSSAYSFSRLRSTTRSLDTCRTHVRVDTVV